MSFTDPLFQFQSYISGVVGVGGLETNQSITEDSKVLRIDPIWEEFRGEGVTISTGPLVDRLHPDIAPNYDTSTLSVFDPLDSIETSPEAAFLSTFWAGIAAGDDNDLGIVGVAPDATIASYLIGNDAYGDIRIIPNGTDREAAAPDLSFVAQGRGGLGLFVVANTPNGSVRISDITGGPAGEFNTDFALHNDRHLVTVMPVSLADTTQLTRTSGDMMLIAAPVFTDTSFATADVSETPMIGPDPRGDLGLQQPSETLGLWQLIAETSTGVDIDEADYAVDFTGQGGSAVTAGVAALMYEANPNLGWRDMQEILVYSAIPIEEPPSILDLPNFEIEVNGADTWNGGGLQYNTDFGFGAIDVFGAVRLAETWTKTSTTANEAEVDGTRLTSLPSGPVSVGDGDPIEFVFSAPQNINVEHVSLSVDYTSTTDILGADTADMFIIRIISPNGTVSDVAADADVFEQLTVEGFDTAFSSRNFWGEESQDGDGLWHVQFILDAVGFGLEVTFDQVDLTFFGSAAVEDDIYVYTDQYDDLGDFNYDGIIDDASGDNIINTSAIAEAVNLTAEAGGTASTSSGQLYTLSNASVISALVSGDGDDILTAGQAGTALSGMRGEDTLEGGAGEDTLEGGDDDDRLEGGQGDDSLDGGDDNDELFGGGSGDDTLIGGRGSDFLFGENGDDTLEGGDGFDLLNGGTDDDLLRGGNGNDRLLGNLGNDTLEGDAGNDTLFGGPSGNDELRGGDNDDKLFGEAGKDFLAGDDGDDTLNGGTNDDTLLGGNGDDSLIGGAGNDSLFGGPTGADTLDGGQGSDFLFAESADDLLIGGDGFDLMNGGAGDDSMLGGNGGDRLEGNLGEDTLDGGSGDDELFGGNGAFADTLIGGTGNDTLFGEQGADTFVFADGFGVDEIRDFQLNGGDVIDLAAVSAITSFADLQTNHLSQDGADAVITAGANSIRLTGIDENDLTSGDFDFLV